MADMPQAHPDVIRAHSWLAGYSGAPMKEYHDEAAYERGRKGRPFPVRSEEEEAAADSREGQYTAWEILG